VNLSIKQSGRPKQFREMVCNLIVPVVRLSPSEECLIEILELGRKVGFLSVPQMVVVED
jgi:hypothetical protein